MSKILVIEDDNKIRSILKEILEEKNHEVDDAADGLDGFKKLEAAIGEFNRITKNDAVRA